MFYTEPHGSARTLTPGKKHALQASWSQLDSPAREMGFSAYVSHLRKRALPYRSPDVQRTGQGRLRPRVRLDRSQVLPCCMTACNCQRWLQSLLAMW